LPLAVPATPIVLVAVLLVKITSPGPGFSSQIRTVPKAAGASASDKVRTMRVDAEPGGIPVWPTEGDPRMTRLGKYLRLLWIDELPQLWNVLRGEMSSVGPRPERPEFVESFTRDLPKYPARLLVRAGLTGLAQVAGRIGDTSIRDRLAWDLRYLRRWSPWLDLKILFATVAMAVIRPLRRASSTSSARGGS
jgi:lipopolysaccharide/colanic/teichoic acid biosynthesis glycosyltransferase